MTENTSIMPGEKPRVLLVDDEDQFRTTLAKRLEARGYHVIDVDNGEDAMKAIRHEDPEVVVLDQKMPDMDGVETLQELKKIKPEVQIIMLTGHGDIELARLTGRHDVLAFMQKPAEIEELIEKIEIGRQEYRYAMQRNEIPFVEEKNLKSWLIGSEGSRPGIIILGAIIFLTLFFMPAPEKLITMLSVEKGTPQDEMIRGYAQFRNLAEGQTIAEFYGRLAPYNLEGEREIQAAAQRAKVMVGVLVIAALFWATAAIPIGVTAMLIAVIMYFFQVLPPTGVAKAFASDAVFFIFGVLAMAMAISKTGLDKRIGLLVLSPTTSILKMGLIFAPMVAVCASFLSEHAIIAFIAPIFMLVYLSAIKTGGLSQDKTLVVMMLLTLNYACNVGGPGSPAAGGRNVVMIQILSDYGINITFAQWVMYGLPFVPVMALIVGLYFYLWGRNKVKIKALDIAANVRREADKIGKMTQAEYRTAIVLVLLIFCWSAFSGIYGMGGPVILALVALNILGILRFKDIAHIHWGPVFLYAGATAMGYGLASTGAALWVADLFVAALPTFLSQSGAGLAIASSILVGVLTNFMSDGATVAAIGPIVVPMAIIAEASPVQVGLAAAYASSFAHMLVVGTPNNAIIYATAKDPKTGEQLLTMGDFFKHGFFVLLLSWVVLWSWTILGYWQWLPWPA
ncbi:SLC13 family permease [Desulfonatronovibrio magnus]|uniref:SLC13 family permease n=1 Tax=Desulfonatronovibrio magnus TaxID=698827 RepID=UPI0005EBB541|nr:SLC13 family permease [Desulfonatronovibrio magnus]